MGHKPKYYPFNYLKEIVPEEILSSVEDEIKGFVVNYFKEQKIKLTYCLLELVNLKEKGIGEGYIYAPYKTSQDFDNHWEQYIELVKNLKKEYAGGVSSYRDWYDAGEYIILGASGQQYKPTVGTKLFWHHAEKPSLTIDDFQNDSPEELSEEYIEKYLIDYANRFFKFEFSNHSHYAILVKPLGYIYDRVIESYGNFYLHFGTDKPLSQNEDEAAKEWREFLKDFIYIWYRNRAGKIIEDFNEAADTDLEEFLPEKVGLAKDRDNGVDYLHNNSQAGAHEEPLIEYFRLAHNHTLEKLKLIYDLQHPDEFDVVIIKLILKFKWESALFDDDITYFFKDRMPFTSLGMIPDYNENEEKIQKLIKIFIEKLQCRKVFQVCYHHLNLTIQQLQPLFSQGKIFTSEDAFTHCRDKPIFSFRSKLFLYGLECANEKDVVEGKHTNNILKAHNFYSKKEKTYLRNIDSSILHFSFDQSKSYLKKLSETYNSR